MTQLCTTESSLMQLARRKPRTANVGIFGVGHYHYWPQFDGLLEQLQRKLQALAEKVAACGVDVTNFGLIDDAKGAYALLPKLKAADLDLVFCDMVTYATSSTFGVIVRDLDVPIVLVALQPLPALDYSKASTYMQLCNDDFCSVPEFTGVAVRMGKRPPEVILGMLHDDLIADAELARWCDIAKVLHDLRRARIGHFGHVLESMLDMHTDPTALTAALGCHVSASPQASGSVARGSSTTSEKPDPSVTSYQPSLKRKEWMTCPAASTSSICSPALSRLPAYWPAIGYPGP